MDIFKKIFRRSSKRSLRPNCLLTRYPVCFLPGEGNIHFKKTYWSGVPEYLRIHGYEVHVLKPGNKITADSLQGVMEELRPLLQKHGRLHLMTYSIRALDALGLLTLTETERWFSSVTLVNPEFLTGPELLPVLTQFVRPEKVMLGSILTTDPPENLSSRISQQVAKSLGPVFREYPCFTDSLGSAGHAGKDILTSPAFGSVFRERTSSPSSLLPLRSGSAHDMYLDHCIFLAEYDLSHAE